MDRPARCRMVGGPEDGVTFEMTGFASSIGVGIDDQGMYYATISNDDAFDFDYQWRRIT